MAYRMRRRGLGSCDDSVTTSSACQIPLDSRGVQTIGISDPNYRGASAQNFLCWLNWLQCEQPGAAPPTLSPQDQALAQQFGVSIDNLGGSGRPGAYIPPGSAPSPILNVQPIAQPVATVPANLPGATLTTTPSPGFLSGTLLGLPIWLVLLGGGVAAYFAFGSQHGR